MKKYTTAMLFVLLMTWLAGAPTDGVTYSQGKSPKAAKFVWIEGEDASKHNFVARSDFDARNYAQTRNRLSGDDWLSNSGRSDGKVFAAEWDFKAPKSGVYQVWTRKFWKHGPFKWRIGKSKWQEVTRAAGLEDDMSLARFVGANWVWMGEAKLKSGKAKLQIELLAKEGQSATACFDCFVITQGAFQPRGKLKPGEKSGDADSGKFAFEPELEVEEEGLFDLRRLNEKVAGESGFVTHKKGRFIRGDGKTMRMWGVNIGPGILELGDASLTHLARMLSRKGVNAVRIHSPIFDKASKPREKVDAYLLNRLHLAVSTFKAEGIYSTLSFYFPLWFNEPSEAEAEGYEGRADAKPFGAIFFAPKLQKLHRAWAKELLTSKNPHTGLALGKDPAVAFVELVNEDSVFFWTFSSQNIPAEQLARLDGLFGAWLTKKYKSCDAALSSWGWRNAPRDDPKKKHMTVMNPWDMTWDGVRNDAAKRKRMADQLHFLADLQRDYYEGEIKHYRKKFKVKTMISCSNWHTADARIMAPIEHHTYHSGDIVDRHAYFGGRHQGDANSYAIRAGQTFESRSALASPEATPFANARYESLPEIYSEFGWPGPNRFRAEWPFLSAAYGSLQGIDGFFHFAINNGYWSNSSDKFSVSSPAAMASFPAYALAYRRGDIAEGKEIVHEKMAIDELYNFAGSKIPQTVNLDALRGGDGKARVSEGDPRLALAPFIGKARLEFAKKSDLSFDKSAIAKGIDNKAGVMTSKSKELIWDFANSIAKIDTERMAAFCGFPKGAIKVGDFEFTSKNEYLSLAAIALDDEKLKSSTKILLQAMTEDRPYGWRQNGNRIENTGGYPMNIKEIKASLTFKRSEKPKRVRVLDARGFPTKATVDWSYKKGVLSLTLPEDGLYTLIEYAKKKSKK